jgi:shikimate dehydrogenase
VIKNYTIIINTSPVGTFPNVKECPNLPYNCITDKHVVYDLIYNPIETLFLRQAETCGAAIQNGWQMFVGQALKSYEIWEGVRWSE